MNLCAFNSTDKDGLLTHTVITLMFGSFMNSFSNNHIDLVSSVSKRNLCRDFAQKITLLGEYKPEEDPEVTISCTSSVSLRLLTSSLPLKVGRLYARKGSP